MDIYQFVNEYKKLDSLESLINMKEYGVLKPYLNSNNELVHSLFFVKANTLNKNTNSKEVIDVNKENKDSAKIMKENPKEMPQKEGWTALCCGTLISSENAILKFSDKTNLKSLLKNLNVDNPKDVKLVSGIPFMSLTLYFKSNNTEYLIPLDDGSWNEETASLKIYEVTEYINKLDPVLNELWTKTKEYRDESDPSKKIEGMNIL